MTYNIESKFFFLNLGVEGSILHVFWKSSDELWVEAKKHK